MEFPITIENQESFDSIVKERLDRQEKNLKQSFDDEKNALNQKISELETKLADDAEKYKDYDDIKNSVGIKDLELIKVKSAVKFGLPLEMADRLSGEDLESIEKDAEAFSKFIKSNDDGGFTPPTPNPEPKEPEDGVTKLFRDLNPNLKI